MLKKIIILLILLALFFSGAVLIASYFSKNQKIEIFFKNSQDKAENSALEKGLDNATNKISDNLELTLEQKIGQLFIVSVKGKEVDEETEEFIKNYHPGGILLLKDNISNETQLKDFIFALQKISLNDTGLPLFIAVDQEGGLISRIKWAEKTSQEDIASPSQAFNIAKKRGDDLANDYIDLNFSPVLDASVKGDFVYDRTFKKDLPESGEMAKSMVSGYKISKVHSCLKHFPGYVGISFNPEDKLAAVDKIPEISQFKKAAESNPEFIMVSNVIYKELDPNLPFSFIKSGIDYLRSNISGNYIAISDDLSQYSVLNNFSLEEIVSSPINAGMDMLIFSNWRKDPKEGIEALKKAFKEKKVSEKRIDDAVSKIIKLKQAK